MAELDVLLVVQRGAGDVDPFAAARHHKRALTIQKDNTGFAVVRSATS